MNSNFKFQQKKINLPVFTRRLNTARARKSALVATHAYLPWSSGSNARMVMLCSVMFNLSLGRFPVQIGSHVITGSGSPVAEQLTVTFVYKNEKVKRVFSKISCGEGAGGVFEEGSSIQVFP